MGKRRNDTPNPSEIDGLGSWEERCDGSGEVQELSFEGRWKLERMHLTQWRPDSPDLGKFPILCGLQKWWNKCHYCNFSCSSLERVFKIKKIGYTPGDVAIIASLISSGYDAAKDPRPLRARLLWEFAAACIDVLVSLPNGEAEANWQRGGSYHSLGKAFAAQKNYISLYLSEFSGHNSLIPMGMIEVLAETVQCHAKYATIALAERWDLWKPSTDEEKIEFFERFLEEFFPGNENYQRILRECLLRS